MTKKAIEFLEKKAEYLRSKITEIYEHSFDIDKDRRVYIGKDGRYFVISTLHFPKGSSGSVVVEHADNLEEAKKNRFYDGFCFAPDYYPTDDELLEAVIEEIEEG